MDLKIFPICLNEAVKHISDITCLSAQTLLPTGCRDLLVRQAGVTFTVVQFTVSILRGPAHATNRCDRLPCWCYARLSHQAVHMTISTSARLWINESRSAVWLCYYILVLLMFVSFSSPSHLWTVDLSLSPPDSSPLSLPLQLCVPWRVWMEEYAARGSTASARLASPVASASFHSSRHSKHRRREATSSPSTQCLWSQTSTSLSSQGAPSWRRQRQSSPYLCHNQGTPRLKVAQLFVSASRSRWIFDNGGNMLKNLWFLPFLNFSAFQCARAPHTGHLCSHPAYRPIRYQASSQDRATHDPRAARAKGTMLPGDDAQTSCEQRRTLMCWRRDLWSFCYVLNLSLSHLALVQQHPTSCSD